ncbi:ATP-grasp domain-containing protein [Streptomyces thermoalcalitolerans]|uniref:ATP-grasp domain-containing protein n=1 Tax=Streptomyces thermoalcalitolerans TaxID=65605 RepID=A0ABP3ZPY1_9ACTN
MTGAAVLLLDAAGPESAALVRAASKRGLQVHAATTTADAQVPAPELAGQVVTDFARLDRAVEDISTYARRRSVGAVLTANEYLTELAALVCAELGLPGNAPSLAHAARDKAAMAGVLTAAGVRIPCTRLVHDDTDLQNALADMRIGLPCVIKPVDAAGSAGVTVVTSPADTAAAANAARVARGRYGVNNAGNAGILVQAYVAGDEYSVESITQNAVTTHLAVTRKVVTGGAHRVETGHSLPVRLPPATEAAVHREVDAAIRAVGIRHGASHTEVVIDADGRCTVIEIAARLGAGHIGLLLQHALGIDVFAALLDVALGHPAALTPTAHGHATVRFITAPHAGRLTALTGFPKQGPGVPFVRWRAAMGGLVNTAASNADRLGCFVVTGPDAAEVEQRADALARQIHVQVDPTPAPDDCDQLNSASRSAIAP